MLSAVEGPSEEFNLQQQEVIDNVLLKVEGSKLVDNL
jgi:hypothetical protein